MWVLLILAAVTTAPAPGSTSRGQAKASAVATIRVMDAVQASAQEWTSAARRSDRVVRDEFGRKFRVRTIDFE